MALKILINGITLDNSVVNPLLTNIKYWLTKGYEIFIIGNKNLKKNIADKKIINTKSIKFLSINENSQITSKLKLILIGLKRNFLLIKNISKYTNKYDIIYSRSSVLDLIIFPFILKKTNPKMIWCVVFDNIVPLNDPGNKLYRFLAWSFFKISVSMIRQADIIFTISPDLKKYLIQKKISPSKIVVTGNAIESNLIKKSRPHKESYDSLFIGRINETKGIYDMLKVIEKVKKELPNFKLAIIGDGDPKTKNKFKNKIKKLNLSKNITFLGTITGTKKFSIIKSSKSFIFLSKSKSESFGIALLEAVACGIPAFAYKLPVFTKIYQNNEVIFSPINRTDIVAEKIINLFHHQKFINHNGKKLLNQYSWEKIAKIEAKAIKNKFKSSLTD